ncbi:MAG: DUF86 domain-containing protein [Bacteroidota bacterium]|nr:DUF86 domain-containing protein [Bacteroidota bacterium]
MKHILEECRYLQQIIQSGITFESFIRDETLKRAVVRSLEIIGEATKNIPIDEKLKYPNIKWKQMAGMRNRLIHEYMGINYIIVWDVLTENIPVLMKQIEEALRN